MDETDKLLSIASNTDIQKCFKAIEDVIDFKLPISDQQVFLYFRNYINDPEPNFITLWKADEKKNYWYHKFINGVLGDVQNSLACVLYHHNRLLEIENNLIESIEKFDYRKILPSNSVIAGGSTLVWDFEFQAFVLAFRRCLDYLARAICNYFMNDFHSFRKFGVYLEKINRPSISQPLIKVYNKYVGEFDFVLSEGNRKSVRDKISHYEYVTAGTINLSKRGFELVGGGAELLGVSNFSNMQLSEVLEKHTSNLRKCVRDLIFKFVDTLKVEER